MRTLTLGVLIVTVGTFAALPFRRYQAIPDASSVPSQASGPTRSALDASHEDPGEPTTKVAGQATDSGKDITLADTDLLETLPQWSRRPQPQRERRIDIPLTFEDLQMPIDQPAAIADKFSATAPVRKKRMEHEQIAGMEMPRMESLEASQREELRKVAESLESATTFASTTSRERNTQQLPNAQPVERDRHWIRQPE